MTGADEERVELRLLADSSFHEEFDIAVDEIAELYVTDQFTGEEKSKVEEHFLKSPERQNKVKFLGELLRQTALRQSDHAADIAPPVVIDPKGVNDPKDAIQPNPGLFERFGSWWRNQSVSLRAATTFATLVIVVGLAFLLRPGSGEPTYQSLELAMASSDRSAGGEDAKVKLESDTDGLRIKLRLPDNAPPAKNYHVRLRDERGSRQLAVEQQDSQSLTVVVPSNELTRGSYAIELSAVESNGTEVPLRGAYLFTID